MVYVHVDSAVSHGSDMDGVMRAGISPWPISFAARLKTVDGAPAGFAVLRGRSMGGVAMARTSHILPPAK